MILHVRDPAADLHTPPLNVVPHQEGVLGPPVSADKRTCRVRLKLTKTPGAPTDTQSTAPKPELPQVEPIPPQDQLDTHLITNNDERPHPQAIVEQSTHSSPLYDEVQYNDEFANNRVRLTQSPKEELLTTSAPHLTDVVADGNPEYNLPSCLVGTYDDDKFFGPVMKHTDRYAQFEQYDGLIFISNSDHRILCIPDIMIGSCRAREIIISQAHSILAHLGVQKMLYYLKDNVWWPSLTSDVKAFCESCHICATTKSNTTAPLGLLCSLSVPDRPWEIIGMDFVGPLPES